MYNVEENLLISLYYDWKCILEADTNYTFSIQIIVNAVIKSRNIPLNQKYLYMCVCMHMRVY